MKGQGGQTEPCLISRLGWEVRKEPSLNGSGLQRGQVSCWSWFDGAQDQRCPQPHPFLVASLGMSPHCKTSSFSQEPMRSLHRTPVPWELCKLTGLELNDTGGQVLFWGPRRVQWLRAQFWRKMNSTFSAQQLHESKQVSPPLWVPIRSSVK